MEQCPQCGNYMKFNMEYSCGYPLIYYNCTCCGYDERTGRKTTYTTSTSDFVNGNIPVAKN